MISRPALAAFLVFCIGCSKPETGSGTALTTTPPALTSAAITAVASSTSAAPAASAAPKSVAYAGDYESAVTTLTVPADVKWKGDVKPEEAVGKGTVEIKVSPEGLVTGVASGPLGDVLLSGTSAEGVVSGSVLRKTPADMGWAGSFYATEQAGVLKGVIRVSKGNAGGAREAPFSLSAKK